MSCRRIGPQVVCHELVWGEPIFLQQFAHQFQRCPLVPLSLDEDVQHFALGIYGAPQVDQAAIDFEVDLVEMPGSVGPESALRRSAAILGPKWFTQRRTVS